MLGRPASTSWMAFTPMKVEFLWPGSMAMSQFLTAVSASANSTKPFVGSFSEKKSNDSITLAAANSEEML